MLYAVGDLHLDANKKRIPDAVDRVLLTLDTVYRSARENGVGDIVLLGDIFDSAYPETEDVIKLNKFLKARSKVFWHIIMGNHDFDDVKHHALRHTRWLCRIGTLNGKVYTEPEVVQIDDENYFMCPHPYVQDQPKGVRFSFGHFGYAGAKGDNGYVIRSKNEPKGRWILGDYHTPQRGKRFIYAGALCQVKHYEPPKKYYIELDDAPRLVAVDPALRLGRTTITSEDDLKRLDPEVFYSVNIESGAKLPPNWAETYKNIVMHHVEKAVSKRAQILMKQVASENPLEGLREYLINNEGLSDKDVRRSFQLLGVKT